MAATRRGVRANASPIRENQGRCERRSSAALASNRLRVVVAHFLAQGPDQGVESALVLALRKGGGEMRLEQLPHAGVGEHQLDPVAHVDARDPRLREDEYDEPGVVLRRADLPVGGGLNRPRRKVPFRRLAVE